MNPKAAQWLMSHDTGTSSKAIVATIEAAPYILGAQRFATHPSDPDDLGRCIRLLEAVPEYKDQMCVMKGVSLVWSLLVDNWDDLTHWYKASKTECYLRMQTLISLGRGVTVRCPECGRVAGPRNWNVYSRESSYFRNPDIEKGSIETNCLICHSKHRVAWKRQATE